MFIRCYEQLSEGKELKLSHHWMPLDKISPSLPVAVIASEDANFLHHHGFDFKAIEHAAKRNMQNPEKRKLGASTISQQTAKNVFLWPGRSWLRKGFEFYVDSPTNQQFVVIDNEQVEQLERKVEFSHFGQTDHHHTICRFVTSWATTEEEINTLEQILIG